MSDHDFLPVSAMELPRFAGVPTFMRLPLVALDDPRIERVQIGLIGVPWDGGTTNRAGARHGPRQIRDLSSMIRVLNQATGRRPFHEARTADLGDCSVNPADLMATLERVTRHLTAVVEKGIAPMVVGGDHLTALPSLRALAQGRRLGLVQFDAHTDLYESHFGGSRYTHGTPFRRGLEEGLLDPGRMIVIGVRGTSYDGEDVAFAREQGVRICMVEELMDRGVDAVMDEARGIVGDGPTYVSFDIDGIDPSMAPGTGTPEIGGFTSHQAQRMVRRLDGLDLVGADLVEVSPPFDPSGNTAWVGCNIIFELLSVLAPAVARRAG